MVRSYINGLVWLALLLSLPSCSEETMPGTEKAEGRVYSFTITQQTDANATEHEGIRTVTLVFTDTGNKIVAVETISQANFEGTTTTDPVLRGTVTLEVDKAATAVYAFANLESANLQNRPTFAVGNTFDANAIAQIANVNNLEVTKEKAIPMSSHKYDIPASGGTEDNPANIGTIYLYRMIAKVEVTLTNNTAETVTIHSLSLGNFQHRDICLLPYDGLKNMTDDNKETRPVFPTTTGTVPTYSLPILSTATPFTKDQKLDPAYTHYIHETDLGENNYIQVSAKIGTEQETISANTQFTFVRRNDYLKIPLLLDLNQLVIELTESYAPIGGYPIEKPFEVSADNQPITINVYEGSTIKLTLKVQNISGDKQVTDLNLKYNGTDPGLLYPITPTGDANTYIAQIPAQPTDAEFTYTLSANLGGSPYTRELIFKVKELDAAATRTTKSTLRSTGASLVLKEFYQLSCQQAND